MSFSLQEVEQKIELAVKQLTDNQGLLSQKIQQIEQLTNDKGTLTALIHQLNGYITAWNEIKNGFQVVKSVVSAVESVAPEVAPAAPEASNA